MTTDNADPAMELLTMLSAVRSAPTSLLAVDLGTDEYRVLRLISRLRDLGYEIGFRLGRVKIHPRGAAKCQLAADDYHVRIYGY